MFSRYIFLMFLLLPGVSQARPDVHHWQTENGARVYFIETHALPMLDIRLVFDAASARDPEGLQGLAMMTSDMLLEGSGKLDSKTVAEGFEGRGAEISTSSLRDMAIVSLRSLSATEHLDPVVSLLASVVSSPRFPGSALERERKRALQALQHELQSPAAVGKRRMFEVLYKGHPYANAKIGTRQGIEAISRNDLVDFHRQYYVAKNMVIAMVGDVNIARAREIAANISKQLPAGKKASPLSEPQAIQGGRQHIEFPSTQTHLLIGQHAIKRNDEHFFALKVGNHGLGGGGFQSRLLHEIRELRGLAYGAYSYFMPMQQTGPFLASLSTKNDQVSEALQVTEDVINDFLRNGPTDSEVEMAKKNITGGFPLGIDSNRELVGTLGMIGFYGLPADYLDTYIGRVNAVTRDEIKKAFKSVLSDETMFTLTVGRSNAKP